VREKILKHASSTPVLYGSPVAGFELGVGSEMHIEESSEVSSEVVNEPIGGHKGVDAHLTGSREGTTVEPTEIAARALQNELNARDAEVERRAAELEVWEEEARVKGRPLERLPRLILIGGVCHPEVPHARRVINPGCTEPFVEQCPL